MSVEFKAHRVYIVVWPDENIVKVGYTGHHRWRTFVNLGAEIYALYVFRNHTDAFDYETTLHQFLWGRSQLAFEDRHEAASHLGSGGAGWMETHRLHDLALLQALPEPPDGHCMIGPWRPWYTRTWELPEAIHGRDGRYGQTHGQEPSEEISPSATPAGGLTESIISAALIARRVMARTA